MLADSIRTQVNSPIPDDYANGIFLIENSDDVQMLQELKLEYCPNKLRSFVCMKIRKRLRQLKAKGLVPTRI